MKRLIASLAALGIVAAGPAAATTAKTTTAKAKVHKTVKLAAKNSKTSKKPAK